MMDESKLQVTRKSDDSSVILSSARSSLVHVVGGMRGPTISVAKNPAHQSSFG